PLKLTRWANSAFPRPHIDSEWLAECYHWVSTAKKTSDYSRIDYVQVVVATEEQILGSDLADSTVRGTGFGPEISQVSEGYLQGPPILVQVIAFTE
ncbi:hypothetical protein HYPSUDRAFT_102046, partial [Hypholoma sublateritium FD-334 SS-4]